MKKSVLKGIFFGVVLFAALFVFETLMNVGNTDMTAEMSPASYPLVYMNVSGEQVNCLHGYRSEMELAYMRDTITPLEGSRDIGITVEKFGTSIASVSYQVRSGDGSRLIEETEIAEYQETENTLTASFTLKDLLEQGKEYNLVTCLRLQSGRDIFYYTRILPGEEYHVWEKVEFVRKFHENTFHKATAGENLSLYLEPSKEGDNSSFAKVDIHSSLDQVTWGNLSVTKESEAVVDIKEMMSQTASFQVHYEVKIPYEGREEEYFVTEYYRIRYTPERIYLLDFEREMYGLFDEKKNVYSGNKISLGIQENGDVELTECDGGNIFAFVVGGKLFSYNVADNKLAVLFGFYNEDNHDKRTVYDKHKIKVLNVDEAGNVQFVVYGYMNRGRHEGENGVQVNFYNSSQNTVEEMVFIPYTKSADLLQQDVDKLSFAGNNNRFYMMVDSTIYEMNLSSKQCGVIAENMDGDSCKASASGKMLAWVEENGGESGTMQFMNLMSGKQMIIQVGYREYVRPLGFMGDDLIYGIADKGDVAKDNSGRIFFPMHTVRIQDEKGDVLKEYNEPGIYVVSCDVQENQIMLYRVKKEIDEANGELVYTEESNDQIMYSKKEDTGKNLVETVIVDVMETLTQIAVKSAVDTDTLQLLTPREVLFEGENKIIPPKSQETVERYFVYTTHGLTGVYTEEAEAVNTAYDEAGVVTDDTGSYVWYRGNRVTRNQIMKITGGETADESTSELAVCLNTILAFEGVNRSTQYMLDSGMTTVDILRENIQDIRALDLTGCELDAILYYTNQDIPVLAMLEDGSAFLVTGFNELNIVVMDPKDGTVYKIGMNDATAMFSESGNRFITYMRTGQ